MPWCDDCARFYNPNTLTPEGTCPSCGAKLARPPRRAKSRAGSGGAPGTAGGSLPGDEAADEDERSPIPWHFWLLLVALAIYLGWRLVQLIGWLAS